MNRWDKRETDVVIVPRKQLLTTMAIGGAAAGFVGFIIGLMSQSGTC